MTLASTHPRSLIGIILAGAAWIAAASLAPPALGQATETPGSVAMTPQQIETILRVRGYDRLQEVTREADDRYRIASAERFGEPVGPIEVDALRGQVVDEKPLTEAQARTLLRARGYSDVPEIREEGGVILVRARREGQEVALRIDPRTGAVRPQ